MDGDVFPAKEGVVRQRIDSCKVTGREVVNNGGSFVEKHIEPHVADFHLLIINGDVVAIIHDNGGKQGKVEEPLLAKDKVVSVAATDADMSDAKAEVPDLCIILL